MATIERQKPSIDLSDDVLDNIGNNWSLKLETTETTNEDLASLVEALGPIDVRELPKRGPEHLSPLLLLVEDLVADYVSARSDHIASCETCASMVAGLEAGDAA